MYYSRSTLWDREVIEKKEVAGNGMALSHGTLWFYPAKLLKIKDRAKKFFAKCSGTRSMRLLKPVNTIVTQLRVPWDTVGTNGDV